METRLGDNLVTIDYRDVNVQSCCTCETSKLKTSATSIFFLKENNYHEAHLFDKEMRQAGHGGVCL